MSTCNPEGHAAIEGAPAFCAECAAPLCLRKQVINLALGYADEMYCLVCLAGEKNKDPEDILVSMRDYVHLRECFRTQWLRYRNRNWCPDPKGCFPNICFS